MKNKILIALFVIAALIVAWGVLKSKKSLFGNPQIDTSITVDGGLPVGVKNIETFPVSTEKPKSFEGVEMVTYKSSYGYEITYPKSWKLKDTTNAFYKKVFSAIDIEPIEVIPYSGIDYLILISVREGTIDRLKNEINSGNEVVKNIRSTTELKPVVMNSLVGLKKSLRDPSAYYFFEKNGKLYEVSFFYDALLNISEQEALWVLSTFKIVK